MDDFETSWRFKYDMFMLRHKKEFLRAIIIILVIVVVILLAVFLTGQKWEFNINFKPEQGAPPAQSAEQPSEPQQPPQPFWPWEQPTQPPEPKPIVTKTSIKITEVHMTDGIARMFLENTGTENFKLTSATLYDIYNTLYPTDIALGREYSPGETDALTFSNEKISCNTFSKVVVETDKGAVATFNELPSGC